MKLKYITRASIVGAILVSLNYPLLANIIWSITNPILSYSCYKNSNKEQAELFAVFTLIAWFGVFNLWK